MKALVVPREKIETVRRKLLESGYLDAKRKLTLVGEYSHIPITDDAPDGEGPYPIIRQDRIEYYNPKPHLADLIRGHLDNDLIDLLPSGWQMLGDIMMVSLHRNLHYVRTHIGAALLRMYPYCKSVVLNYGIRGELRQPACEIIAIRDGVTDPGQTLHLENGCRFRLDVTRIMFSKGNLMERKRMSRLGSGEVVVDMFAGIGYFTIPMAVHSRPQKIYAIELNPESYHYLVENSRQNRVEHIVLPIEGDCAQKTPISLAHRVVMGYVGNTHRYLQYGIRALRPGGILHYHETVPQSLMPSRPLERIQAEGRTQGRDVEILGWHKVKKYSPGVWHVVVDARIT